MKRQYYLRGFVRGVGIGIVLTALIMGITSKAEQPMTDAEIRAKALTLGMVDSNSLSLSNVGTSSGGKTSQESPVPSTDTGTLSPSASPDGTENSSSSDVTQPDGDDGMTSPSPSPDVTQPDGDEQIPSPSPSPDDTQQPDGEETSSPSPSPAVTQSSVPEAETVTIVIVRGDNSYTVSRRLEEAGLVESAREYDSYLVANGYSKSIRSGTYRIPLGATWKEIADIIA